MALALVEEGAPNRIIIARIVPVYVLAEGFGRLRFFLRPYPLIKLASSSSLFFHRHM